MLPRMLWKNASLRRVRCNVAAVYAAEVAPARAEHSRRGARAGGHAIDRLHPSRPPIRDQPVRQDVGNRDAIVAHHGHLPERKRLPDRKSKLRRQIGAVERRIEAGMERHARRELDCWSGLHRDVTDRAGERGDLRQRMHRLLQQQIDWRSEHPMAELPRCQLAQRNIVDAAYKVRFAQRARRNQVVQPRERRMVQEVLVHADRCTGVRGSVEQHRTVRSRRGKRLFHQHRLAGLQQRQGHVAMRGRRHQNVGTVERIGCERVIDRGEYLRCLAGPRQARRGVTFRIDDSGDLHPPQRLQCLGVHAGDEAGTDQGDAPHRPDFRTFCRQTRPGVNATDLQPTVICMTHRTCIAAFGLVASLAACAVGGGNVLEVGPTQRLKLPSQAAAAAGAGDIIRIAPGDYTDCAVWRANRLTIEATGEGAVLADKTCAGKGIFVIAGNDITVRNLTFARAAVPDRNGAGIRAEGRNLTVEHSKFIDNENGILANPKAGSTIRIVDSEFRGNAKCEAQCAHGIYVNAIDRLEIEHSRFIDQHIGHHIKSRARTRC